jgi:hypothetical protein
MKEYQVEVHETFIRIVTVEALSEEQAFLMWILKL